MKKNILLLISVVVFSVTTKAQNDGFESILLAAEDAEKLVGAYVNPAMDGLIFSMNGGWYHTAKVHKKFGFDVSIGANLSVIPSSEEVFNIANLDLTKTTSTSTDAATVAGTEELQATMTVTTTVNGKEVSATFDMPGGLKEDLPLNAIPAPAIQVNVGLPYKLEAMVRFVPKVGSDHIKGSLFGIGVKKEITSWFGPINKLPLHISLLGAYTNMTIDYDIANDISSSNISTIDGKAEFDLNSYTLQAIASLNFRIINVYGGIGYGAGNADLGVLGTYELSYETNTGGTEKEIITNPINRSFDAGSFRTTLGVRLSLGFFKIFADYTLQEYNTINGGIAFSFR